MSTCYLQIPEKEMWGGDWMMLQAHHMQKTASAGRSETDVFLMKTSSSSFEFNPASPDVIQISPSD